MKWFMSYCFSTPNDSRVRFAFSVYDGEEHPVSLIARWNGSEGSTDASSHRFNVLLYYTELSPTENVPETGYSCG